MIVQFNRFFTTVVTHITVSVNRNVSIRCRVVSTGFNTSSNTMFDILALDVSDWRISILVVRTAT